MFSNKITDNSTASQNAKVGLENFSRLALAVSLSALLAACGSDGDSGSSVIAEGDVVPSMAITVNKPTLNGGESTDISVRFTDQNNDLITETIEVVFSSSCLADDRAIIDGETSTSDGAARVTYTATGCTGTDVLNVIATVGDTRLQSSASVMIDADTVAGVTASEPEPNRLALRGIGGAEESSITFTVRGQNGAPISDQVVNFEIRPGTGGVSFNRSSVQQTVQGETGDDGTVTIKVYSGTANTIFRVLAEHAATGNSTESADISVSTGVPVQSKFVLALDRFNPPSAHRQGQEVQVSVIASDQYGNPATDGTIVNFWSPELGQIDPSCALENGRCSVTWVSSGASPSDSDYRSTIIAFTDGAEDFTDQNGNNVYDSGDAFNIADDDLPEAYTNENEQGGFDVGEFFVDFNHNQMRDVGDGVWNGPCLSSVDQSALCQGDERVTISDTHVIVNSSDTPQILANGSFGAPQSTINIAGPTVLSGLIVSDDHGSLPWGNSMPDGTTYSFATTNGTIDTGASITVPNNTTIGQNLSITISPDGVNSNGVLSLTVAPPNGAAETVYTWILSD